MSTTRIWKHWAQRSRDIWHSHQIPVDLQIYRLEKGFVTTMGTPYLIQIEMPSNSNPGLKLAKVTRELYQNHNVKTERLLRVPCKHFQFRTQRGGENAATEWSCFAHFFLPPFFFLAFFFSSLNLGWQNVMMFSESKFLMRSPSMRSIPTVLYKTGQRVKRCDFAGLTLSFSTLRAWECRANRPASKDLYMTFSA